MKQTPFTLLAFVQPHRKKPIICDFSSNGCYEITSHKGQTHNGYSRIRYQTRKILAHRRVWEYHHGTIPDDLCVLHRCDNRKCVNIDHLFLGTVADNNADKMQKGRHVALAGEQHPRSKFTDDDVRSIKLLKGIVSQRHLAKHYGVHRTAIRAIHKGLTWQHVRI